MCGIAGLVASRPISDEPVRFDENFQTDGSPDAFHFEDQGILHRHFLENFAGAVLCVAN